MSFQQRARLLIHAALIPLSAAAEPPMHVDDAGALGKGGMKIESALSRDHKTRGADLLFGFAPLENLEVGLAVVRARDRADDPAAKLQGTSIAFKWVPLQNETGWSLGMSLALDRTRVDDRANDERWTEKSHALTGLATYRFQDGQKFHANLGVVRRKAPDERDTLGAWGIGYEYPLAEKLQLTAEVFGQEKARPDKALGLRFEVAEGFKLSGALGRGNDRNFGQIGFAWEF